MPIWLRDRIKICEGELDGDEDGGAVDPLSEVLERCGGLHWLDAVKARIVENWAGDPSVSESNAARAVEVYRRDLAEHERLEREYSAYVASHEAEREEFAKRAAEKAFEKARARVLAERQDIREAEQVVWVDDLPPPVGPEIQVAITARRQAREQYDKRHPLQSFTEWRPR